MKTAHYSYNDHTYTVETTATNRYQMSVWDEKDHDSYGITDPSLIIAVLTKGKKIEAEILDEYTLIFIEAAMKKLGYNTDIKDGADYRHRLYGHLNEASQTAIAQEIERA